MTLYTIIFISVLSMFSSCKGENRSKSIKENTAKIGFPVTKIDKTIWAIYQDKNTHYWFGSKENGVFHYDGKILKNITINDGLISNQIRGFQEDSKGNIFIETEKGVSKYDGKSIKNLPIIEGIYAANDWKLEPDDLWFRIGSGNNGVYRFDGEYLYYLKFPKSPQEDEFIRKNKDFNTNLKPYGLYTIYRDKKGNMWFGTASLGVCRYDGRSLSWYYEDQLQTTPSGGDFGTRAIFEDKDGKFWINNSHFRYNIQPSQGKIVNFQKENGIGHSLNKNKEIDYPFFSSITEDNTGNLWMVTYKEGVWKYNGKDLIHFPIKDENADVLLFTIFKDTKGILWLGSHNKGVYKFNGQMFEKFLD